MLFFFTSIEKLCPDSSQCSMECEFAYLPHPLLAHIRHIQTVSEFPQMSQDFELKMSLQTLQNFEEFGHQEASLSTRKDSSALSPTNPET